MIKPVFNVEKDIPIAKAKSSNNIYPFGSMEIGDSFVVPLKYKAIQKARMSLWNMLNKYNKVNSKNYKIITRSTSEGLRVWRIA